MVTQCLSHLAQVWQPVPDRCQSHDASQCQQQVCIFLQLLSNPAEMQVSAPEVVTIDQIYPNWQEKVEAVKAAIARRANRRLIFQQVNGRMIPIGVSGSGNRDLAAMIEAARNSGASDSGSRSSRRSRRSRSDAARRPDYGQE